MMRTLAVLALLACAATAGGAALVPADRDPEVEARVARLAVTLRCLVCQNQTIADSNAPLAIDLRTQIREQIALGKTDAQISAFMVERYGDFVLYKPPLKASTVLLWAGPFGLLLIGGVVVAVNVRRRRAAAEERPLSAEERDRAARLLGIDPDRKQS